VRQTGCPHADLLTIGTWAHVNPADLASDYGKHLTRLQTAFASRGLSAIALNTGTTVQLHDRKPESNLARDRETEALCRLMAEFRIPVAAIQPLAADRTRPGDVVMADCIASLRQQYAIAAKYGVRFAVELHVHSPFETLEQAQTLLKQMPEVNVVYDPTHFILQGMPLKDTLWIMDRAIHVHARDAAKGKLQAPLGSGEIDFNFLISALKDRGFAGNISIEYLETRDFDVVDSARRLRDLFVQHFP
jgi:sugar phosphate isomerase/epimerase